MAYDNGNSGSGSKTLKYIGIGVGVLALLLIITAWRTNNKLVSADEEVNKAVGQMNAAYQRRMDLIPSLMETVKGYAAHEKEVFTAVTEARAKAGQIQLNAEDLSAESIQKFKSAQDEMFSSSLSRLMLVAERYPDLKASDNFRAFQAQLEGTENRINTERNIFNKAVTDYNKVGRRFPGVIFAGMFGYEKKAVFQAEAGAEKAPKVEF